MKPVDDDKKGKVSDFVKFEFKGRTWYGHREGIEEMARLVHDAEMSRNAAHNIFPRQQGHYESMAIVDKKTGKTLFYNNDMDGYDSIVCDKDNVPCWSMTKHKVNMWKCSQCSNVRVIGCDCSNVSCEHRTSPDLAFVCCDCKMRALQSTPNPVE